MPILYEVKERRKLKKKYKEIKKEEKFQKHGILRLNMFEFSIFNSTFTTTFPQQIACISYVWWWSENACLFVTSHTTQNTICAMVKKEIF